MTFYTKAIEHLRAQSQLPLHERTSHPYFASWTRGVRYHSMNMELWEIYRRIPTAYERQVIRETGRERLGRRYCTECLLRLDNGEARCPNGHEAAIE